MCIKGILSFDLAPDFIARHLVGRTCLSEVAAESERDKRIRARLANLLDYGTKRCQFNLCPWLALFRHLSHLAQCCVTFCRGNCSRKCRG